MCLPACTLGVGKYYFWLLAFLAAARNNQFSTILCTCSGVLYTVHVPSGSLLLHLRHCRDRYAHR